jgi:hypothetical protein
MSKRKPVRDIVMFPPSHDSLELLRGDTNTLFMFVANMATELRKAGMRIPLLAHPTIDDTCGSLDDDDDDDDDV